MEVVDRLQRLLLARTRLSFEAAQGDGIKGDFAVLEEGGVAAALTAALGLEFLNIVTVAHGAVISDLERVIEKFRAAGAPFPAVILPSDDESRAAQLRKLGLHPGATRPCAGLLVRQDPARQVNSGVGRVRVTRVGGALEDGRFTRTLLSAYDASPAVARFIAADHEAAGVRRYLAWLDGEPVGAAAMSRHAEGWVLGGAATLERFRGNGVQGALLRARLADIQHELHNSDGAEIPVAVTAAPGSPSLRNLARAGFTVFPRRSWVAQPSLA